MSGVGGSVRDQLLRLQSATDHFRHERDVLERESTGFSKTIQDLKFERHKLALEKQEIQEKLARFSNEDLWLQQQRELLIQQKKEDNKALVASAQESAQAELEETERKKKFCNDMKNYTDKHETLLHLLSTMRMKTLVCPETASFLVANMPQVATKDGPFTPEIATRLQIAAQKLNQATLDCCQLKEQQGCLVEKLFAFRKQALSLGFQGLTENELRNQECKWKVMNEETAQGGASSRYGDKDGVTTYSHLDAFYGTESSSHMTEASGFHHFDNPAEEVTDSNTDSMDYDFSDETYD